MVKLMTVNNSNDTVNGKFNKGNKSRYMKATMIKTVKMMPKIIIMVKYIYNI